MKTTITSSQAVRRFGDCLSRVKFRRDTFLIVKNKEPIAELVPVPEGRGGIWKDVVAAVHALPGDPTFADDLDRVNASDQLPKNPWD